MTDSKKWTLRFEEDGLVYTAGYGYMAVFENGERIFQALDVFKMKEAPMKESVVHVYKCLSNLSEKKGNCDD